MPAIQLFSVPIIEYLKLEILFLKMVSPHTWHCCLLNFSEEFTQKGKSRGNSKKRVHMVRYYVQTERQNYSCGN